MKKTIAIIASIALACTLAFSLTSCKNDKKADNKEAVAEIVNDDVVPAIGGSNEAKAVAYQQALIDAVKKDDIDTFIKLTKEMMKFAQGLSDDEQEAIGEKLDGMYTPEDEKLVEEFCMKHLDELAQLGELAEEFE